MLDLIEGVVDAGGKVCHYSGVVKSSIRNKNQRLLSNVRRQAALNGVDCTLTADYCVEGKCYYCDIGSTNITRVDKGLAYSSENCRLVCDDCFNMTVRYEYDFIEHCKWIASRF